MSPTATILLTVAIVAALYLGQDVLIPLALAILLSFAISRANACELCSTFMRKEIIGWGEDPEQLTLTPREQVIWDFGHQLAKDANRVSDALYARLAAEFSPPQIVELTTFGALMIVNNVFNSALRIDVDEVLDPYRIDPEQYFA